MKVDEVKTYLIPCERPVRRGWTAQSNVSLWAFGRGANIKSVPNYWQ